MNVIWLIDLDRYGNESRAKDSMGKVYSVVETADLLIEKLKNTSYIPEIHIISVGIGRAFSDYLKHKGVKHKRIDSLLMRIGSADIHKFKNE